MNKCASCGAAFDGSLSTCPYCGNAAGAGFERPPPAGPGGFGQPPSGAQGGFGQPPSGAQGGFGAPPFGAAGGGAPPGAGQRPPAGGYGGAPAGSPAAPYVPPGGPMPSFSNAVPMMGASEGPAPNTGLALGLAVAVTLCCCLPGGIWALVLANQAGTAVKMGDNLSASQKVKQAYIVMAIAAVLGGIANAVYLAIQLSGRL